MILSKTHNLKFELFEIIVKRDFRRSQNVNNK